MNIHFGVIEIDTTILKFLEPDILINVLSTNKYYNSINNDDYFWKLKVIEDFGEEVNKHKPKNETNNKQYYMILHNIFDTYYNCQDGRVDLLIHTLYSFPKTSIDEIDIEVAAEYGHLDILIYIYSIKKLLPNINALNYACINGRLDVLKWVYNISKLLPDNNEIYECSLNGHQHVLDWLSNKIIIDEIVKLNCDTVNGKLNILKITKKELGIFPDKKCADYLCKTKHFDILEWLETYNIIPSIYGANYAAINNNKKIVDWLITKNIYPNCMAVHHLVVNNNLEMLKYLYKLNIKISQEAAYEAKLRKKYKVLKWLKSIGINPYGE